MRHHTRRPLFHFDEFTVLEVFLAVAIFGLVTGGVFLALFPEIRNETVAAVVRTSPTGDEYRRQAAVVLQPFLMQAVSLTPAELEREATGASLAEFASKTQDAFLMLRVPAELRDPHLEITLLLDRWKRRPWGTPEDIAKLSADTKELAATYTWAMITE